MVTDASTENDDLAGSDEQEPRKASGKILQHELQEAIDALDRPANRLFYSGVAAGLEIGFSLLLMASVRYMSEGQLPAPIMEILVANMYSFGFILVVVGRSELFTEQTSLAVMPVLSGDASAVSVVRLWSIIFVANLIGAAAFAGMAAIVGPALGTFNAETLTTIARRMTDHSGWANLLSAILAGWLMGLLSWLVAAGRDTISQIVIVWMIATAIGLGHLHHVILGTAEVLAGVFSGGVSWAAFGHFLFWTTLGNAVGGPLFVALLKTSHAKLETE